MGLFERMRVAHWKALFLARIWNFLDSLIFWSGVQTEPPSRRICLRNIRLFSEVSCQRVSELYSCSLLHRRNPHHIAGCASLLLHIRGRNSRSEYHDIPALCILFYFCQLDRAVADIVRCVERPGLDRDYAPVNGHSSQCSLVRSHPEDGLSRF